MAVLAKVQDYTKNVIKSVGYTTGEVVGNLLPTTGEFASENKEVFVNAFSAIRNYKRTFQKIGDAITKSKIYEAVDTAWKNALDDLKTGNFYNKAREAKAEEAAFNMGDFSTDSFGDAEADLGGGGDLNLDIGDDFDKLLSDTDDFGLDENGDEINVSDGDVLVAKTVAGTGKDVANTIASTQVRATDAMLKSGRINTNILYTQNEKLMGITQTGFTNATNALENLAKFNTDVLKTHTDNATKYFTESTNMDKERNAMLKELLEMQRNLYKAQMGEEEQKEKKQKLRFGDITTSSGAIDLEGYWESIKQNTGIAIENSQFGMLKMFMNMEGMGENPLLMFAQSPLSFIATSVAGALVGPSLQKAATNFDKTLGGIFGKIIADFNHMKNEEGIWSTIGTIFGTVDNVRGSLDTANYKRGQLPWDGEAKKALVEVIPQYLASIEAALTGREHRLFDYKSGMFVNSADLKTQFQDIHDRAVNKGTNELMTELMKFVNAKQFMRKDEQDQENFFRNLRQFQKALFNDPALLTTVNNIRLRPKEEGDEIKSDMVYTLGFGGNNAEQDLDVIIDALEKVEKLNKGAITGTYRDVLESRSALNREMEAMNDDFSDVRRQLFTRGYIENRDRDGIITNNRTDLIHRLDLNQMKDKYRANIFDYLRGIQTELVTIRKRGYGINSTSTGNMGQQGQYVYITRGNKIRAIPVKQPAQPPLASAQASDLAGTSSEALPMTPEEIRNRTKRKERERYETQWKENRKKAQELKTSKKGYTGPEYVDWSSGDEEAVKDYELQRALKMQETFEKLQKQEKRDVEEDRNWLSKQIKGFTDTNKAEYAEQWKTVKEKGLLQSLMDAETFEEKWHIFRVGIENLANKPADFLIKHLESADEYLYKFFFKQEEKILKNGQRVDGFFGRVRWEFENIFDKINGGLNKYLFEPLKEKLGVEGPWDAVKKALNYIGIDVEAIQTQVKEGAAGFFNPIKDNIVDTFSSQFAETREELNELKRQAEEKLKEEERKAKGSEEAEASSGESSSSETPTKIKPKVDIKTKEEIIKEEIQKQISAIDFSNIDNNSALSGELRDQIKEAKRELVRSQMENRLRDRSSEMSKLKSEEDDLNAQLIQLQQQLGGEGAATTDATLSQLNNIKIQQIKALLNNKHKDYERLKAQQAVREKLIERRTQEHIDSLKTEEEKEVYRTALIEEGEREAYNQGTADSIRDRRLIGANISSFNKDQLTEFKGSMARIGRLSNDSEEAANAIQTLLTSFSTQKDIDNANTQIDTFKEQLKQVQEAINSVNKDVQNTIKSGNWQTSNIPALNESLDLLRVERDKIQEQIKEFEDFVTTNKDRLVTEEEREEWAGILRGVSSRYNRKEEIQKQLREKNYQRKVQEAKENPNLKIHENRVYEALDDWDVDPNDIRFREIENKLDNKRERQGFNLFRRKAQSEKSEFSKSHEFVYAGLTDVEKGLVNDFVGANPELAYDLGYSQFFDKFLKDQLGIENKTLINRLHHSIRDSFTKSKGDVDSLFDSKNIAKILRKEAAKLKNEVSSETNTDRKKHLETVYGSLTESRAISKMSRRTGDMTSEDFLTEKEKAAGALMEFHKRDDANVNKAISEAELTASINNDILNVLTSIETKFDKGTPLSQDMSSMKDTIHVDITNLQNAITNLQVFADIRQTLKDLYHFLEGTSSTESDLGEQQRRINESGTTSTTSTSEETQPSPENVEGDINVTANVDMTSTNTALDNIKTSITATNTALTNIQTTFGDTKKILEEIRDAVQSSQVESNATGTPLFGLKSPDKYGLSALTKGELLVSPQGKVSEVTETKVHQVEKGTAVIPKAFNPTNHDADKFDIESQIQGEMQAKKDFSQTMANYFKDTIPAFATGTTGFESLEIKDEKKYVDELAQSIAKTVDMNAEGTKAITVHKNSKPFYNLLTELKEKAGQLTPQEMALLIRRINDIQKQEKFRDKNFSSLTGDEKESDIWSRAREIAITEGEIYKEGGYDTINLGDETMSREDFIKRAKALESQAARARNKEAAEYFKDNTAVKNILTGVNNFKESMTDAIIGITGLDSKEVKEATKDIGQQVLDGIPNTVGKGLLGGVVGLFLGGPLVGAMLGGAAGFVQSNENLKQALFGKKLTDKNGDEYREGGIISRDIIEVFNKYAPSMKNLGLAGMVAGLITPFGPLGGALIGAGIGALKSNDDFMEFMFGSKDKDNGILSKAQQKFIKKSLPNIGAGALAGVFLGPFGLFGNLAFGAGAGLFASTETFKEQIFGRVDENGNRVGGLVNALKKGVVDPWVAFGKRTKDELFDWVKYEVFAPLKGAFAPIGKQVQLAVTGMFKGLSLTIGHWYKTVIGRPIATWLQEKFMTPISKFATNLLGTILKPAKWLLSRPSHMIGALGDVLRRRQIQMGNADYMTAGERLKFRREHGLNYDLADIQERSTKGKKITEDEQYALLDSNLVKMDRHTLTKAIEAATLFRDGTDKVDDIKSKAIKQMWADLYGILGGRGTKEHFWQDASRDEIDKLIKAGKIEEAKDKLREELKKPREDLDKNSLTHEKIEEALRMVTQTSDRVGAANKMVENARAGKNVVSQMMKETVGFEINESNVSKYLNMAKKELDSRKALDKDVKDGKISQGSAAVVTAIQESGKGMQAIFVDKFDEMINVLEVISEGVLTPSDRMELNKQSGIWRGAQEEFLQDFKSRKEKRQNELNAAFKGQVDLDDEGWQLMTRISDNGRYDKIIEMGKLGFPIKLVSKLIFTQPKLFDRIYSLYKDYGTVTEEFQELNEFDDREFDTMKMYLSTIDNGRRKTDVGSLKDIKNIQRELDARNPDDIRQALVAINKFRTEYNVTNDRIGLKDILHLYKTGQLEMFLNNIANQTMKDNVFTKISGLGTTMDEEGNLKSSSNVIMQNAMKARDKITTGRDFGDRVGDWFLNNISTTGRTTTRGIGNWLYNFGHEYRGTHAMQPEDTKLADVSHYYGFAPTEDAYKYRQQAFREIGKYYTDSMQSGYQEQSVNDVAKSSHAQELLGSHATGGIIDDSDTLFTRMIESHFDGGMIGDMANQIMNIVNTIPIENVTELVQNIGENIVDKTLDAIADKLSDNIIDLKNKIFPGFAGAKNESLVEADEEDEKTILTKIDSDIIDTNQKLIDQLIGIKTSILYTSNAITNAISDLNVESHASGGIIGEEELKPIPEIIIPGKENVGDKEIFIPGATKASNQKIIIPGREEVVESKEIEIPNFIKDKERALAKQDKSIIPFKTETEITDQVATVAWDIRDLIKALVEIEKLNYAATSFMAKSIANGSSIASNVEDVIDITPVDGESIEKPIPIEGVQSPIALLEAPKPRISSHNAPIQTPDTINLPGEIYGDNIYEFDVIPDAIDFTTSVSQIQQPVQVEDPFQRPIRRKVPFARKKQIARAKKLSQAKGFTPAASIISKQEETIPEDEEEAALLSVEERVQPIALLPPPKESAKKEDVQTTFPGVIALPESISKENLKQQILDLIPKNISEAISTFDKNFTMFDMDERIDLNDRFDKFLFSEEFENQYGKQISSSSLSDQLKETKPYFEQEDFLRNVVILGMEQFRRLGIDTSSIDIESFDYSNGIEGLVKSGYSSNKIISQLMEKMGINEDTEFAFEKLGRDKRFTMRQLKEMDVDSQVDLTRNILKSLKGSDLMGIAATKSDDYVEIPTNFGIQRMKKARDGSATVPVSVDDKLIGEKVTEEHEAVLDQRDVQFKIYELLLGKGKKKEEKKKESDWLTTLLAALGWLGSFLGGLLTGLLNRLKNLFGEFKLPNLFKWLEEGWAKFKTSIGEFFERVKKFGGEILERVKAGFRNIKESIKAFGKGVFENIKTFGKGFFEKIKTGIKTILPERIYNALSDVGSRISSGVGKVITSLESVAEKLGKPFKGIAEKLGITAGMESLRQTEEETNAKNKAAHEAKIERLKYEIEDRAGKSFNEMNLEERMRYSRELARLAGIPPEEIRSSNFKLFREAVKNRYGDIKQNIKDTISGKAELEREAEINRQRALYQQKLDQIKYDIEDRAGKSFNEMNLEERMRYSREMARLSGEAPEEYQRSRYRRFREYIGDKYQGYQDFKESIRDRYRNFKQGIVDRFRGTPEQMEAGRMYGDLALEERPTPVESIERPGWLRSKLGSMWEGGVEGVGKLGAEAAALGGTMYSGLKAADTALGNQFGYWYKAPAYVGKMVATMPLAAVEGLQMGGRIVRRAIPFSGQSNFTALANVMGEDTAAGLASREAEMAKMQEALKLKNINEQTRLAREAIEKSTGKSFETMTETEKIMFGNKAAREAEIKSAQLATEQAGKFTTRAQIILEGEGSKLAKAGKLVAESASSATNQIASIVYNVLSKIGNIAVKVISNIPGLGRILTPERLKAPFEKLASKITEVIAKKAAGAVLAKFLMRFAGVVGMAMLAYDLTTHFYSAMANPGVVLKIADQNNITEGERILAGICGAISGAFGGLIDAETLADLAIDTLGELLDIGEDTRKKREETEAELQAYRNEKGDQSITLEQMMDQKGLLNKQDVISNIMDGLQALPQYIWTGVSGILEGVPRFILNKIGEFGTFIFDAGEAISNIADFWSKLADRSWQIIKAGGQLSEEDLMNLNKSVEIADDDPYKSIKESMKSFAAQHAFITGTIGVVVGWAGKAIGSVTQNFGAIFTDIKNLGSTMLDGMIEGDFEKTFTPLTTAASRVTDGNPFSSIVPVGMQIVGAMAIPITAVTWVIKKARQFLDDQPRSESNEGMFDEIGQLASDGKMAEFWDYKNPYKTDGHYTEVVKGIIFDIGKAAYTPFAAINWAGNGLRGMTEGLLTKLCGEEIKLDWYTNYTGFPLSAEYLGHMESKNSILGPIVETIYKFILAPFKAVSYIFSGIGSFLDGVKDVVGSGLKKIQDTWNDLKNFFNRVDEQNKNINVPKPPKSEEEKKKEEEDKKTTEANNYIDGHKSDIEKYALENGITVEEAKKIISEEYKKSAQAADKALGISTVTGKNPVADDTFKMYEQSNLSDEEMRSRWTEYKMKEYENTNLDRLVELQEQLLEEAKKTNQDTEKRREFVKNNANLVAQHRNAANGDVNITEDMIIAKAYEDYLERTNDALEKVIQVKSARGSLRSFGGQSRRARRDSIKAIKSAMGNRRLTNFSQIDNPIANKRFNIPQDTTVQTVADSACGPFAAMSAIANTCGTSVNDMVGSVKRALRQKEADGGTKFEYFSEEAKRHGLTSTHTTSKASIDDAVKRGEQAVVMTRDPNMTKSSDDGVSGPGHHYSNIAGITPDGKGYIVANPEKRAGELQLVPRDKFKSHISDGFVFRQGKGTGRGGIIEDKILGPAFDIFKKTESYAKLKEMGWTGSSLMDLGNLYGGSTPSASPTTTTNFNTSTNNVFNNNTTTTDTTNSQPLPQSSGNIPQYKQYDPQWTSRWGDLQASGCAPTSTAIQAEGLTGQIHTPSMVADWAVDNGYRDDKPGLITQYAHTHGYEVEPISYATESTGKPALEAMQAGLPVVIGLEAGAIGLGGNAGHYVVGQGIQDGKVLINNPGRNNEPGNEGFEAVHTWNELISTQPDFYVPRSPTGKGSEDYGEFGTGEQLDESEEAVKRRDFVWSWLRDPNKGGLPEAGAAGIMGNIAIESPPFDPTYVEGGTHANEIAETGLEQGSPGYGLFQFTYPTIKSGLVDFAKEKNKSTGDLETQLEYAKWLSTEGPEQSYKAWEHMKEATDPAAAVDQFMNDFERPGITHNDRRVDAGKQIFEKYSGKRITSAGNPPSTSSGSTSSTSGSTGNLLQDIMSLFFGGAPSSSSQPSGDSSQSNSSSGNTNSPPKPSEYNAKYVNTGHYLDDYATYMSDFAQEKYSKTVPTVFWRTILRSEQGINNEEDTSYHNNPGGMDYGEYMATEFGGSPSPAGTKDNEGNAHNIARFDTIEHGLQCETDYFCNDEKTFDWAKQEINLVQQGKYEDAFRIHNEHYINNGRPFEEQGYYHVLPEELARGENLRTGDDQRTKRTGKGSGRVQDVIPEEYMPKPIIDDNDYGMNAMRAQQQADGECTIEATKLMYRAYNNEDIYPDFGSWAGYMDAIAKETQFGSDDGEKSKFETYVENWFSQHPGNPLFLYQTGGAGDPNASPFYHTRQYNGLVHPLNRWSGDHAVVIGRKRTDGYYEIYDSNGGMVHYLPLDAIFDRTAFGGTDRSKMPEGAGNTLWVPTIDPSSPITEWQGDEGKPDGSFSAASGTPVSSGGNNTSTTPSSSSAPQQQSNPIDFITAKLLPEMNKYTKLYYGDALSKMGINVDNVFAAGKGSGRYDIEYGKGTTDESKEKPKNIPNYKGPANNVIDFRQDSKTTQESKYKAQTKWVSEHPQINKPQDVQQKEDPSLAYYRNPQLNEVDFFGTVIAKQKAMKIQLTDVGLGSGRYGRFAPAGVLAAAGWAILRKIFKAGLRVILRGSRTEAQIDAIVQQAMIWLEANAPRLYKVFKGVDSLGDAVDAIANFDTAQAEEFVNYAIEEFKAAFPEYFQGNGSGGGFGSGRGYTPYDFKEQEIFEPITFDLEEPKEVVEEIPVEQDSFESFFKQEISRLDTRIDHIKSLLDRNADKYLSDIRKRDEEINKLQSKAKTPITTKTEPIETSLPKPTQTKLEDVLNQRINDLRDQLSREVDERKEEREKLEKELENTTTDVEQKQEQAKSDLEEAKEKDAQREEEKKEEKEKKEAADKEAERDKKLEEKLDSLKNDKDKEDPVTAMDSLEEKIRKGIEDSKNNSPTVPEITDDESTPKTALQQLEEDRHAMYARLSGYDQEEEGSAKDLMNKLNKSKELNELNQERYDLEAKEREESKKDEEDKTDVEQKQEDIDKDIEDAKEKDVPVDDKEKTEDELTDEEKKKKEEDEKAAKEQSDKINKALEEAELARKTAAEKAIEEQKKSIEDAKNKDVSVEDKEKIEDELTDEEKKKKEEAERDRAIQEHSDKINKALEEAELARKTAAEKTIEEQKKSIEEAKDVSVDDEEKTETIIIDENKTEMNPISEDQTQPKPNVIWDESPMKGIPEGFDIPTTNGHPMDESGAKTIPGLDIPGIGGGFDLGSIFGGSNNEDKSNGFDLGGMLGGIFGGSGNNDEGSNGFDFSGIFGGSGDNEESSGGFGIPGLGGIDVGSIFGGSGNDEEGSNGFDFGGMLGGIFGGSGNNDEGSNGFDFSSIFGGSNNEEGSNGFDFGGMLGGIFGGSDSDGSGGLKLPGGGFGIPGLGGCFGTDEESGGMDLGGILGGVFGKKTEEGQPEEDLVRQLEDAKRKEEEEIASRTPIDETPPVNEEDIEASRQIQQEVTQTKPIPVEPEPVVVEQSKQTVTQENPMAPAGGDTSQQILQVLQTIARNSEIIAQALSSLTNLQTNQASTAQPSNTGMGTAPTNVTNNYNANTFVSTSVRNGIAPKLPGIDEGVKNSGAIQILAQALANIGSR